MHEEMNRRKAELSEAALEGVSGGLLPKYYEKAASLCHHCHNYGYCSVSKQELGEYLQEHGIDDISNPRYCPFA